MTHGFEHVSRRKRCRIGGVPCEKFETTLGRTKLDLSMRDILRREISTIRIIKKKIILLIHRKRK